MVAVPASEYLEAVAEEAEEEPVANAVLEEDQAPLDPLDLQAILAILEHLVPLDSPESLCQHPVNRLLRRPALPALEANLDSPDLLDHLGLLEDLDSLVKAAETHSPDRLVLLAHQETLEALDNLEDPDNLDSLHHRKGLDPHRQARLERPEHLDSLEILARLDSPEDLDNLARRVLLDLLDSPETMDSQDPLVPLATLEVLARRASAPNTVPSMAACSSRTEPEDVDQQQQRPVDQLNITTRSVPFALFLLSISQFAQRKAIMTL